MSNAAKLAKFFAERNAAFENDDIEWARRNFPGKPSAEIVVHIAFHKARAACEAVSSTKRQESVNWLVSRGYSPMTGFEGLPKRPS
jgi:ribulose-5-phosphate 4-epimerase/fuculose-1-phosphate aldolase